MTMTIEQKKRLYWGLGILTAVVLTSVAWAQIHAAMTSCYSPF